MMKSSSAPGKPIPNQHNQPSPGQIRSCRSRIVAGADASYWGQIALRWAAEHAWLAGAELEVDAPPADPGHDESPIDSIGRTLRDFPLLRVELHSSKDGVGTLLRASQQADLVVLGCRGADHRGLGLGSTVAPVATGADCDVMVVGGRPAAVRGAHRSISVLVGTDGDEQALRSAAELAALRRALLRIILAVPAIGPHPLRARTDQYHIMLDNAARLVNDYTPTVRAITELTWTNPHEAITTLRDTDVLVLGVAGRLDATVRTALHHAANPVLIARPRIRAV